MSKEQFCYRILKRYGLLVDFDGEPERVTVPAQESEDETFSAWRKRVLGEHVSNVRVFLPVDAKEAGFGKVRISTLQRKAGDHPWVVLRAFGRMRAERMEGKLDGKVEQVRATFENFPVETLEDIQRDIDSELTSATSGLLDRIIGDATDGVVDTENLITVLVKHLNAQQLAFEQLKRRLDDHNDRE